MSDIRKISEYITYEEKEGFIPESIEVTASFFVGMNKMITNQEMQGDFDVKQYTKDKMCEQIMYEIYKNLRSLWPEYTQELMRVYNPYAPENKILMDMHRQIEEIIYDR